MYLNQFFEVQDLQALYQCIHEYPLATIILQHQGELEVNHIPLELERSEGTLGILKGHIAKHLKTQNPEMATSIRTYALKDTDQ